MLDLKAIMDDYFSFMPNAAEENSPPSVEFITAPTSLANSPSESGTVSEVKNEDDETFHEPSCDERNETAAMAQDVVKIEQDTNQLLSFGDVLRKDLEALKQDAQIHHPSSPLSPSSSEPKHTTTLSRPQRLSFDATSPTKSPESEYKVPRPSTPFRPRIRRRSFSSSSIPTSPVSPDLDSETSFPPILQPFQFPSLHARSPPPATDLETIKAALKVIQSQLGLVEKGIKKNIEEQIAAIDFAMGTVMDDSSLPGFKVKDGEGGKWTSRSLLDTVKVLCVVERGLEGVVSVLELGKDEGEGRAGGMGERDGDGEKGLMETCLERSKMVRREMRDVLKGVEGVLRFEGESGC